MLSRHEYMIRVIAFIATLMKNLLKSQTKLSPWRSDIAEFDVWGWARKSGSFIKRFTCLRRSDHAEWYVACQSDDYASSTNTVRSKTKKTVATETIGGSKGAPWTRLPRPFFSFLCSFHETLVNIRYWRLFPPTPRIENPGSSTEN